MLIAKMCSGFLYNVHPISKKLEKSVSPRYRQMYVALGPTLLTISLGMTEGFSAIFLPQLLEENHFWNININMESWIASIATIPMPFACLVGGYVMEIFGRKVTHMLDCFLSLLGWGVLYYASDTSGILIGRMISGFSVSLIAPAAGVYFAETSDPSFRSMLLALLPFGLSFGIFLSHLLGIFFAWRQVTLVCCVFPILSFVLMTFAPESPTFLIKTGKIEAGKESFYWCRGQDVESQKELNFLLERKSKSNYKSQKPDFKLYLQTEFVKPFLVMLVFFFVLQWCGSNALVFYSVDILELSLGKNTNKTLSMIGIDLVRVIFSILALYLQKKLLRRTHAISTTLGVVISLITLSAVLFASRYNSFVLERFNSVIIVALVSYMIFLSAGLTPLPWTMLGEVFPLVSRGLGSGIATCVNFAFIFSVVKSTPYLFKNVGKDVAFLVYALCTLGGLVVLALFLPETKDKTLQQIEEDFKNEDIDMLRES